jgi:hypothetical protein
MLVGKDTNEVKSLLGVPSYRENAGQFWNYDMGQGGGGLGFLFHSLKISFNKGQVSTVMHVQISD